MPINSKQKGSDFERKVAKMLTEWSGYEFRRTPMSGALHWENDARVLSDIVPPLNLGFPFSIECKKREDSWDFDFILKGTSSIWEFWKQCLRDAQSEDLEPLLVLSKNRRETYAMMRKDTADILLMDKAIRYLDIGYTKSCMTTLVNFSDLLNCCSLQDFLNIKGKLH